MKKFIVLIALLALALTAFADDNRGVAVKGFAAPSSKERRTALIIGNSTYLVSPLKNPANDARAIAQALRDLGFAVDVHTNLSMNEMKRAVEAFGRNIREGGIGLFYYAGHGMQVNGRNYLIPVDADIQGEVEVDIKAVDAGAVLAKMDMAHNDMNIVILDACRNNPFSRSFRATNLGLASMNAPSGTLIAYATAPGSVASDGSGANGLYTQEVVKAIKKPGLKIEDAFKQVRSGVQKQTQGKQVPWESSSLVGDFYFSGSASGAGISPLDSLAEGSKERQAELNRLKKLEAESAKQKKKEQAEIANKEKELAKLDAQIVSIKSKLGTASAGPNDSLQKMLAMVEKQEIEARKLEELRQQREAEEKKRQSEIEKLKKQAEEKRKAEIEKDIATYEKIAASPYGKSIAQNAWQSLVSKYSLAKDVAEGDTGDLRNLLIKGIVTKTDPEMGMKMVLVKGGCFQMGDTFGVGARDVKPAHDVCVNDYYISTYEVTQAQWRSIMDNNPSTFKGCGDTCPVENVSWIDIQEFLRILNLRTGKNYRLPTEAEWEYAARSGGKNEKWAGTSSENDLVDYAWYDRNAKYQPHPVGKKKSTELGIYDMSGNVSEWVQDWYEQNYYQSSPKENPQGPSSGYDRVIRGGSWFNLATNTGVEKRDKYAPQSKDYKIGFRLVRTP